jgi:ATP-dependent Clp protease ATP-binding subunit ClpC
MPNRTQQIKKTIRSALRWFRQKKGVFTRYTEPARRVIFFARYEAGMRESSEITPLHLLLGLLREKDPSAALALGLPQNSDAICKQINLPEVNLSLDPTRAIMISLDQDAKIVLAWTAAEADRDDEVKIDPSYLVRGLLCFPNAASSVLNAVGIELEAVRTAAKEGRLRVPLRRRIAHRLWRVMTDAIWPAIRTLALILGFVLLAIIILRLFGVG